MNIIFAGTPVFAEHHLRALIDSDHNICAVYTQPDRPAGRGKKLHASPVKLLAEQHNLPVFQPASLKSEDAQQQLQQHQADIMVVVAYGLLLPQTVLDKPRLGCINVHGSILPKWRGAAPIQRAVQAGDAESGVTIMQMDIGLDTGAMILKAFCPITPDETSASLHDKLANIGPGALLDALTRIENGQVDAEPQDDTLSTYARKIEKSEAMIDWSCDAISIERNIRAFNPFPICYTELDGQRVKIHEARLVKNFANLKAGHIMVEGARLMVGTTTESIELIRIQLPGKKTMSVKDYLNGVSHKLPATQFSQP